METDLKWYLGFLLGIFLCLTVGSLARELTEAQKFYEAVKSGYSQVYDKESGSILWQKLEDKNHE